MDVKLNIYKDLNTLNCCPRCIVRFLNMDGSCLDYNNPNSYLDELNHDNTANEEPDEVKCKKQKNNSCRICLNILVEENLDKFVEQVKQSDAIEYTSEDYNVSISFPKSIYIRSYALFVYLKDKYSDNYKDKHLVPFNKIFRYSIKDKLTKALEKPFNLKSTVDISLNFTYEDDEKEIVNVAKLDTSKFSNKSISRNSIFDILLSVDETLFKQNFSIPPEIPSNEAKLSGVTTCASYFYIGGRYRKYSRKMGQTPWIINGAKVTEHCVQDFIFDAIRKVLDIPNNMVFSSSGREDADVRMLGDGRPFYIQIENLKNWNITSDQFKLIEDEIKSSGLVEVDHLQIVDKEDLKLIKEGEESKKKCYSALCIIENEDENKIYEILRLINNYGEVEVSQKTPIRVLHRRTQAVRTKKIYEMTAKLIKDKWNLFELELVTQAGTYVKEFVHGDLERTTPNLGTIIGCPVDIIGLDVNNIYLDWPINKNKL